MSLEHSEILTHKSPLGSTKLAPQSPPTYLENSHEAILASGALQATQYLKTEYLKLPQLINLFLSSM